MAAILNAMNKFVALVKKLFEIFGMGGIFEQLTGLI